MVTQCIPKSPQDLLSYKSSSSSLCLDLISANHLAASVCNSVITVTSASGGNATSNSSLQSTQQSSSQPSQPSQETQSDSTSSSSLPESQSPFVPLKLPLVTETELASPYSELRDMYSTVSLQQMQQMTVSLLMMELLGFPINVDEFEGYICTSSLKWKNYLVTYDIAVARGEQLL